MSRVLSTACPLLLSLSLAACASPSVPRVYTFESAPLDWSALDRPASSGQAPGLTPARDLRVAENGLELAGSKAYVVPALAGDVRASVDVALTGGSPRGFAGLFIVPGVPGQELDAAEAGPPDRILGQAVAVAIRGSGEERSYPSNDPREPRGGAGWRSGDLAGGFHRLEITTQGRTVRCRIDGRDVGEHTLSLDASPGEGAAGEDTPIWHLGIFCEDANARWHHLAAGVDDFDPASVVAWGDASTAGRLVSSFGERRKAFEERPSRGGLLELAAIVDGVTRIGDISSQDRLAGEITSSRESLVSAARRASESTLLARLLETWGARRTQGTGDGVESEHATNAEEHERSGRPFEALVHRALAAGVDGHEASRDTLRSTLANLAPLTLHVGVDASRAETESLAEPQRLRNRVQEHYGGLPPAPSPDKASISIDVLVRRARFSKTSDVARRRVPVRAGDRGETALEADEIARLRADLDEDLRDSVARARVVLEGSRFSPAGSRASFEECQIAGRKEQLLSDDCRRLEATASRLARLTAQWEQVKDQVRYEDIDAQRRTSSFAVRLVVDLLCLGQRVADSEELAIYRGLEEWEHAADEARGISASSFPRDSLERAARTVRDQAVQTLGSLVAPATVLSRLEREKQIELLLRLARTSGRDTDGENLRWYLQEELGLSADLRDRAARELLR